ncbi:MAG: RNA 2',3'-cyclic phosphodiesterase [Candidatus Diapherotrites archaeon CG08_land_8_20_14_0_20_34_12]|nr:MAG: RNA 2',3'-cyclic phosphodiesterase [Candidatus Diapherotrites archaeon CG08_land_8_20_14_0_20_34_12]
MGFDIMPSRMKRIFIAVNLPDEIKESFQKLIEKLPKEKVKAVKKENLHITMKFLGDIPEEKLAEIYSKLQDLNKFVKFEVELSDIGFFKTRILWIGITKGKEMLENIAKEIENLLALNKEEFTSHITIARNKFLGSEEFKLLAGELKKIKISGKFTVKSIDVMESVLEKAGSNYKILKRIELK